MFKFTNLKEFNKDLMKFAKAAGVVPGLAATRVAFDLHKRIVQATPVDTGWARASWNITEGRVDTSVGNSKQDFPSGKEFPTWYITNNVSYIIYLEQGRTKQMDKGYMVRRSLNVVQSDIRRAYANIKREKRL